MLWGIFLLFCLLGTVQHFLYRPLCRPRCLEWLLPVSESPWEHCKLAFWPLGGALGTVTLLTGGTLPAFLGAWWAAAAHGLCTMLGIYYFYRAALGVPRPVLWADICNYYITMFFGWRVGLRTLLSAPGWAYGLPAGLCLAAIALLFSTAAVLPPQKYPMFREETNHGRDQRSGTS